MESNIFYNGEVAVRFKIGNKITARQYHNNGTMLLKRLFAMALCGNANAVKYMPAFIDLRQEGATAWESILKTKVAVSAPTYGKDTANTEQTWYSMFSAIIPYMLLKASVSTSSVYRLYLTSNYIANDDENYDLAYIEISGTDLAGLEPGTQVLIEWQMSLLNNPRE